jgi:multidrug efflux system membrane fusion protein
MKLSHNQILVLGFGLSLALTVAGCSRSTKKELAAKTSGPIQVGVAITKDVPIQIRVSGHVTPFATVAIKSQVDGELERALFNEGDEVKGGDSMFVIDSRLLRSTLRLAEANLARDEAIATNAEAEARQNQILAREGIVAAELVEQSRTAADAADTTVAADKVAVENAQLQLSFCRITSPIPGRVGKLLVDAGNSVRGYETTLAVVNQMRPAYVDFLVPEEQLPAIQARMQDGEVNVTTTSPGNPGKPSSGKLLFIDNAADTDTGMVAVRARFANDDEALWPGETVGATLTLSTLTNVIVVPSSAVRPGLTGTYVVVVRPDLKVERRPVTTGNRSGMETLITSGLAPGERLITSGQEHVTLGKPIKIHAEARHSLAGTP